MSSKNQYFVDRWSYLVKKFNLSAELIIVEWNPPKNKNLLKDELKIPHLENSQKIKIITVSNKTHMKFKNSEKIDFFQMKAKNVGIRNAEGKFILCTNIDIVFSSEMIEYLSLQKLKEDKVYRADRYDIDFDRFDLIDPDENIYEKNIRLKNKKLYSIDCLTKKKYYVYPHFLGFFGYFKNGFLRLSNIFKKKEFKSNFLSTDDKAKKINKKRLIQVKEFFESFYNYFVKFFFYPKIHTNGCGDFTLCSKQIWFECRGYFEFDGYSFHVDSLFLWVAHYKKFKSIDLKHKIFHINHKLGSGFTFGDNTLEKRLNDKEIPFISDKEVNDYIKKIRRGDIKNYNLNWGEY